MRFAARIGAALAALACLVPLAYLTIGGGVAAVYGLDDEAGEDAVTLVVLAVLAILVAGGVAVGMWWLARFALTGRARDVSARMVLTAGASGPLLILVTALLILVT